MPQYKLGKKAARLGAVKFKFANYLDVSKFPAIPDFFGHEDLVENIDLGMLGNDTAGDCVWAGGGHETMIFSGMGGNPIVEFSEESVLSDYTAVTGYDPNIPSTDNGTDMQAAAAYRQKVGLLDANGVRHKISAYLALTPGDIGQHMIALYLFGAVGIGILFSQTAMDQFNEGETWDIINDSPTIGGHYVPLVARRETNAIKAISWAKIQSMSARFFQNKNDESLVYLSPEIFKNQKSPELFDYDHLLADLQNLNSTGIIS